MSPAAAPDHFKQRRLSRLAAAPTLADIEGALPRSNTIVPNIFCMCLYGEHELGLETIRPGDDAEAAARRILREKHGKHFSFYDPISYRGPAVSRAARWRAERPLLTV